VRLDAAISNSLRSAAASTGRRIAGGVAVANADPGASATADAAANTTPPPASIDGKGMLINTYA
jgi:hypothetical protein